MAKRTLTNPHGLPEIYSRRQPRRPHELRAWVERRGFRTDAEFAEAIGADKSVVSRWLDEDDPTTPGRDWQRKLGIFFGDEENLADIFSHPDDDWLRKFFKNRERDEIDRIKRTMETAFPKKQASS